MDYRVKTPEICKETLIQKLLDAGFTKIKLCERGIRSKFLNKCLEPMRYEIAEKMKKHHSQFLKRCYSPK